MHQVNLKARPKSLGNWRMMEVSQLDIGEETVL